METSATPKVYDALPEDDGFYIRIVELEGVDAETGEVICQLKTVQFCDNLDYRALSYCWGDSSNPPTIVCNGVRVSVTSNLESALRCLLMKGKARGLPLTFWIDAICINQGDNHEKERQVMMMGDIYRHATQVIVWLGVASDNSELAFDLCNKSYCHELGIITSNAKHKTSTPKKKQISERDWPGIIEPYIHIFFGEDNKFDRRGIHKFVREMDAISAILKRPWWSRIWIIQEVALARNVVVLCGDAEIHWAALDIGITACLKRHWSELFVSLVDAHHADVLFQARQTALHHPSGIAMQSQPSLFELISRFRWSVATDPRDKVYGLLGLADLGPAHQVSKVSYEDDLESCFRTAVLDIIRSSGSLDVLQLCRNPPGPVFISDKMASTLPSWVPDLRLNTNNVNPGVELSHIAPIGLQSRTGVEKELLSYPQLRTRAFCASRDSTVSSPEVKDNKCLELEGLVFDTIKQVSDMQSGREKKLNRRGTEQFNYIREVRARTHSFKKYMRSTATSLSGFPQDFLRIGKSSLLLTRWRRLALSQNAEYPTGESAREAFSKTLHQGWLGTDPETTIGRHIAEWKRILGKVDAIDQSFILRHLSDRSRLRQAVASLVYLALSFHKAPDVALEGVTTYTCFSTTQTGYYVLVPPETREGDSITLLKGSPVPFVIREKTVDGKIRGWELVGSCYVHGIMHGEKWKDELCQPIALV